MDLLIIADDFTGALDTGVQFANAGISTKVVVGDNIDFSKVQEKVLVIDTESRHLSAKESYDIVFEISTKAKAANISYIYKKTDSALRGNIGAELTALLHASDEKVLPFIPAFPQMNRVVREGNLYIDGLPVTKSPFGIDPFEPVKYNLVSDIIKVQSSADTNVLKPGEIPEDKFEGITIFDAQTIEHLENIAKTLSDKKRLHIMAGCAGFGSVLAETLGIKPDKMSLVPTLDERLLVICGSVNPITVNQVKTAEENGFVHYNLTPKQKLTKGFWKSSEGQADLEKIKNLLEQNKLFIIDSNDKGTKEPTIKFADELGMNIDDVREGISGALGYILGQLFTNPSLGTLFITGGDTLLQCMNTIGVKELEPVCEIQKGVVLSKFTFNGCSKYVISKSGGFGKNTLFLEILEKIVHTKNM